MGGMEDGWKGAEFRDMWEGWKTDGGGLSLRICGRGGRWMEGGEFKGWRRVRGKVKDEREEWKVEDKRRG